MTLIDSAPADEAEELMRLLLSMSYADPEIARCSTCGRLSFLPSWWEYG
jgi:hypothetical protein